MPAICDSGTRRSHLPSGRCGLKFGRSGQARISQKSPPFGEVWIEIRTCDNQRHTGMSPPFGEVWIEIYSNSWSISVNTSPPFGEVWIEIVRPCRVIFGYVRHLPSGRCGLKSVGQPERHRELGHLPSGRCGLKCLASRRCR